MQVFRFTYILKTRDNFMALSALIISELQKAVKILSLFCFHYLHISNIFSNFAPQNCETIEK